MSFDNFGCFNNATSSFHIILTSLLTWFDLLRSSHIIGHKPINNYLCTLYIITIIYVQKSKMHFH
ncbi:hypothetical protein HanRHA438_Chr11g0522201 [Helianthus annuus]|nr:hypothetical protein HanRHA438_Chr11g0522201 [Helianthus annuus]